MPQRQWKHPRLLSFSCAASATTAGLAYLHFGSAPPRYLSINAAAFLLGSLCLLVRPHHLKERAMDVAVIAAGVVLCAVGLWGESSFGARRWLLLGGLSVEPAMILLPPAVVIFARRQNALTAAGMLLIDAAVAIQPDRSMAGVLCFALLVSLLVERNRWTVVPCIAASGAVVVALLRTDAVPPVQFVEKVFVSALGLSPVLGLAVIASAFVLLLPALLPTFRWPGSRGVRSVFVAVWAGLFLSTLLGNYPTPVVGYGSSGILGYLLSLSCLNSGDWQA